MSVSKIGDCCAASKENGVAVGKQSRAFTQLNRVPRHRSSHTSSLYYLHWRTMREE